MNLLTIYAKVKSTYQKRVVQYTNCEINIYTEPNW